MATFATARSLAPLERNSKTDQDSQNRSQPFLFSKVLARYFFPLFTGLLLAQSSAMAGAPPLRIAAASDLKHVFDELAKAYTEACKCATTVDASFGSSGQFFAQIKAGAPFDVFMSADSKYPHELIQAGFATNDNLQAYALGRLALVFRKRSALKSLAANQPETVWKELKAFAVANPDHAPYGRAARYVMKALGWEGKWAGKLVRGDNVAQTYHFVDSGAADAGLVPLSLVSGAKLNAEIDFVPVPPELHEGHSDGKLLQSAVALTRSPQLNEARAFLNFLKADQAREVFKRAGFASP